MTDQTMVTPDELRRQLDAGEDVVVLDVRRGSYLRSDAKIEGSMRIDPNDLEEQYEQIPAGATVVTYCTCPREATSARAARFLSSRGYQAAPLAGGFEAWEDASLPTEAKTA
jgi:rhodanese-related sulfurtransferase